MSSGKWRPSCLGLNVLRPVPKGSVVTVDEGACEQEVNPEAVRPRYLMHYSHKPECIVTTNPDRSVLITIITWHFHFASWMLVSPLKTRIWCSKGEPFRVLLILLRHVVPLNDGNCRLTMPVVKGRCARDAQPHTFNISFFRSNKKDCAAIKHIYNESANITEGCNDAFDNSDCQWLPEFPINGATDWHWEYGYTPSPLKHTRFLDIGHM